MPPKLKNASKPPAPTVSNEKSVVKVGPKHVSAKNQGIKNDKGERPTTERALILRHGKYGALGSGELMALGKMTGREKLDLLAEDLVDRAKKAVAAPFSLEKCLKLAEAQCNAYLDDIRSLHDAELFCPLMQGELNSRYPTTTKGGNPPPLKNPTEIASLAAARIHNSYMLASAWRLILYALIELGELGLIDCSSNGARGLLKGNNKVRERFLNVYDLVKVVVDITQKQFSSLAAATPHYATYFKEKALDDKADPEDPVMVFDWVGLRVKDACKSFIDSIIIELCFPEGPYPKGVLYHILHDAVEEAPHHAKRFPQALWDAVGDLSISVELLDLLESPLLTPEGQEWKNQQRTKPSSFDGWLDAQSHSLQASSNVANWKDLIFPLEKTKSRVILESMWKTINANYNSASGKALNVLWNLGEALIPNPSWHAHAIPVDDLLNGKKNMSASNGGKKKPLQLTMGEEDDDSMPELLSVSDSSSDGDGDDSDEDDAGYGESDQSDYDTDQEDDLREMLKEAMDQARQDDFLESMKEAPEMDNVDDKKHNPFLKLLGSLRGRMFSSSSKLKTDNTKVATGAGTGRTTMGPEASDDEAPTATKAKKKKKPKKKKKKKATTSGADADAENDDDDDEDGDEVEPGPVATPAPAADQPNQAPAIPITPATPSKKKKPSVQPPTSPTASIPSAYGSTTSLSLPVAEKAQSAHSYLKESGVTSTKTKTKTRGDPLAAIKEKGHSVLSRFGLGKDKNKDETKEEKEEAEKRSKSGWFDKLTKKGKANMQVLMRTNPAVKQGDLKWEQFLRVMRELGFDYNPSTAGSSVCFYPPDPRDKPITFHKPHPDPTLTRKHIMDFCKRLKDHYGWSVDHLQDKLDATA